MKKARLCLLAVLLIAVGITAVMAQAEGISGVCPYCKRQQEEWIVINKDGFPISEGHYYLQKNYTLGSITVKTNTMTCLDLKGYTYTANKNVKIQNGSTMYVFGGSIQGRGTQPTTTNNVKKEYNGGVFDVEAGGTLTLKDVNFFWDPENTRPVPRGGYLHINGVVNMENTTLTDGKAGGEKEALGGNVFISASGELNMKGGSITGGILTKDNVTNAGRCVYTRGKVTLSGNARVEEIYVVPHSTQGLPAGELLNLESDYTGSVALKLNNVSDTAVDVGNIKAGARLSGVSLLESDLRIRADGTNLVTYLPGNADIMAGDEIVASCDSLADALAAVEEGQYVTLNKDVTEKITITKDVLLDLNGCDVQEVAVESGTLSVMDSKTDDYDVTDGDYGRIKNYTGKVTAHEVDEDFRYLACTDDDGTSFHKLHLEITEVSLRSSVAGLYYVSAFKGDGVIKNQVETFGVSLSINKAELENGQMNPGTYTVIDGEKFNEDASATSSMLVDIMKESNNSLKNRANAATEVYGRPYIKMTGNTILWGQTKNISLQQTVQKILDPDQPYFAKLNPTQKSGLTSLCARFKTAMRKWSFAEVRTSLETEEANTLKVLTIGNSHSNDSNWLLQEVFQSLNTDENQKLVVGILYKSGCSMKEHVDFALNNKQAYTYYKNVDGQWRETHNSTLKDALQDQVWDVVIMQEMNTAAGVASTFSKNTNLQTLVDYVNENTWREPQIGWNLIWANPLTETYWDKETRRTTNAPENPTSWENTYIKNYKGDQMTMYKDIVKQVKNYVLTNDNISEEFVMPSGTAVQYARNMLGLTDIDLYRDYTHISELSRLIVSYLWYAKLFGIEEFTIQDMTLDTVPAHLRQKRFATEGDLDVTDEFKEVILAAVNYALDNAYSVPEPAAKENPKDGTLNVLMIGNSFCYYFPEELKAMADKAGITNFNVYNVYKSGCTLAEHWQYLRNGEKQYELHINGKKVCENVSLWYCLKQQNWDVISLQEGSSVTRRAASGKIAWEGKEGGDGLDGSRTYFAHMYSMLTQRFPDAQIVWHQTWAYQKGKTTHEKPFETDEATQAAQHQTIRDFTQLLINKYPDVDVVNSGDAWALIRANGYDKLCARLGKNAVGAAQDTGDNYHDGDIGGGQFLNACVWYEYLFDLLDLNVQENTFVPTYDRPGSTGGGTLNPSEAGEYRLDSEITPEALRKAAHDAFANRMTPQNSEN